jgi:hypothetical protein
MAAQPLSHLLQGTVEHHDSGPRRPPPAAAPGAVVFDHGLRIDGKASGPASSNRCLDGTGSIVPELSGPAQT